MQLSFCLIILIIQIKFSTCFIETSYLTYIAASGALYYGYRMKCNYLECCKIQEPERVHRNLHSKIASRLYGQPIALKILPSAIHHHVNDANPRNPLVISLHGWTGSGKTYVSEMLAETLFEKGLKSIHVKKITPAVFFPNPDLVNSYKSKLINLLEDQARVCERSLIIIEEIDKLHPELIDTLSSYLNNYNPNLNHMIFIFTSNVGSDKIVSKTYEFYKEGKDREKIELNDFESSIKNQIYNDESSMKYSSLISSHLINHYIPFLPLERSHVAKCVEENLMAKQGKNGIWFNKNEVERIKLQIFESLEWWPNDLKLYSNSGCKQVANKVNIAFEFKR